MLLYVCVHFSFFVLLTHDVVPTPPTEVSVEQLSPVVIQVTWTEPSVSSGRIVYFTVYATPFNSDTVHIPKAKRDAPVLLTVAKVGSVTTWGK